MRRLSSVGAVEALRSLGCIHGFTFTAESVGVPWICNICVLVLPSDECEVCVGNKRGRNSGA